MIPPLIPLAFRVQNSRRLVPVNKEFICQTFLSRFVYARLMKPDFLTL